MNIIAYLKDLMNGIKYGETYHTDTGTWTNNTPPPKEQRQYSPAPSQQPYTPTKTTTPQQEYAQAEPTPQQQYSEVQPTSTPTITARNPAVTKFTISPVVQDAIIKAANKYGVQPSLLFDIALQESSFDPTLANTTPSGEAVGVPKGLFQFTPDTVETIKNYANQPGSSISLPDNIDLFDPYINAEMAAYLIANGQLGRWNASQGVWGPQYSQEEVSPYYSQTLPEYVPTQNWKQ